jgi:DNA-binding NarL/FixJ family response regulator
MMSEQHSSVLLVDDHQMMRLGFSTLLRVQSSMPIRLLEAGNLGDAMALYAEDGAVDLVLLDLSLPDSQGLQSLQRFLARFPNAQIAIFSATEDEFVVRQAINLGAVGFVPKSAQVHLSLEVLESLLQGSRAVQDTQPMGFVHSQPLGQSGSEPLAQARGAKLSPTQLKVLELVLAGLSNQEIANECQLALGTVKNIVSSILLDLDVTSRSHLISIFR